MAALGEGWDGAVPGLPLADTIKRVEDGRVVETLPRDQLVAVQTPQAFAAPVLRKALSGDVAAASDCASLVEARGGRVTVVPGDERLLKVTTPADLALVEAGSVGGQTRVCPPGRSGRGVIVDYHMHLRRAGAGRSEDVDLRVATIEPFLETAAARGVDEIGFTEHVYYFRQTLPIWDLPVPDRTLRLRPRRLLRRGAGGEAAWIAGQARARGRLRR